MSQSPHFFPGTFFGNISYGCPEASVQEVYDVAKDIGLHDEIMRRPQQYHERMEADAKLVICDVITIATCSFFS
jgi:ABC-type multidrug transport system fused ATPase/permease subunit